MTITLIWIGCVILVAALSAGVKADAILIMSGIYTLVIVVAILNEMFDWPRRKPKYPQERE